LLKAWSVVCRLKTSYIAIFVFLRKILVFDLKILPFFVFFLQCLMRAL